MTAPYFAGRVVAVVVLFQVLAVLAVVFGVAVVLTGRGGDMSDEGQDLADTGIPRDRAMTPQDVIGLRFALAFRGYRMSEVDDALDRLAAELAARDEAIERLRAAVPTPREEAPATEWQAEPPVGSQAEAPVEEPAEEPAPTSWWTEALTPAAGVGAAGGLGAGEAPAPEPEPEARPEPQPAPEAAPLAEAGGPAVTPLAEAGEPGKPAESPIFGSMPSPFRPEVPDIPVYDPWSVTPRSRYTDGPTYVEVDEHPDDDVESITEHHTGYAPPPAARDDDAED